jgi:hypothetical protein
MAEVPSAAKTKRKGRKSQERSETSIRRYFMGESSGERITLDREFPSEVEAQLESLKQNQPYHTVESWRAVADLSDGSIAVRKRPVSKS